MTSLYELEKHINTILGTEIITRPTAPAEDDPDEESPTENDPDEENNEISKVSEIENENYDKPEYHE